MRSLRLLGAALGLAVAATLTVAPAQAVNTGYYSVPYDSTLYFHHHGSASTDPASFQEWSADGFPTPTPVATDFVKYSWHPMVYAVSYFGPNREDWVWQNLTFEQWTRAGRPAPRNAGWIPDTTFVQWASSPEIFAGLSNDVDPWHKLTYAEWAAAGHPSPDQYPAAGFYKYPWSSSIGFLWDTTIGDGQTLTYQEYVDLGRPTPQTVTHVNYEHVWRFAGSSQLYLDSPITGWDTPITYSQWSALGRPAPTVY